MSGTITLQYLGRDIRLEKSDQLVAVRARAGMDGAMFEELEVIAPGSADNRHRQAGAFEVVDLTRSKNGIEQDLDWLRSRPSVAAASHVFLGVSGSGVYVPTGNIHMIFSDQASPTRQQATFNQFRLQVIEVRGERDFLMSITSGSKNPVATASALEREAGVDQADPEFAALSLSTAV